MRKTPTHQEFENKIEILKKKIHSQTHLNFYEDLIVALDTSDIVLFVNEKTCKIFGYEEKEMLGKNWFENFAPARAKKILLGETDGITHYENQILTKLREERSIYWHNTPIKDKGGNITGFLSLGEDITGRKRGGQELKKGNNRSEKLQQAAHLGLWELDIIGDKLIWSNEFYRIFDLKPQEIEVAHKTLLKIIHPKDKNRVKEAYSDFLKNKTPYEIEYRLLLKSGEIKHILEKCETAYNGKGEPVRSLGTVLDITKQAQLAEKFKTLSGLLSEGVVIHNKGVAIEVNDSFIKMFGYSQKELIGQNIVELLITKEDQQLVAKNSRKDYSSPYEVKGIKKNGTIFPIEIEGKVFFENNIITTIRDMASCKKVEEKLNKRDKMLMSIISSVVDPIISIDSDGIIMSWNMAAEKIFGYTSSEMINKNLQNIIPINHIIKHKNDINCLKNGSEEKLIGKIIELKSLRKDGTEFPAELSLSSWSIDNQKYFTVIIRDLSEKKLAQEKLKNSEERLSQIIKVSKDWIWEIDTNGLYTYASEKVEDILGYKSAEIVNKKYFYDFFPEENRKKLKKIAFKSFKQKKIFSNFITPNISKNGDIVWFSTSGIPILDNKGNLIGYRGADDDITKRIKTEKKLINAKSEAEDSNRLKDEFLQNMSHEIRTPMNAILGFSEMLSIPDLTDKKRAHFVEIIQNCSNQLVQIIDDILEISRLETKQIKVIEEPVNLNDLFLNLFSIFNIKSKENKIPLYLKKGLSDRQSVILTDKKILNTALNNVLNNALKFTSKGFIELGYQLKNSELEIYVKDTGIGIEPEKHDIIFVRFSQAEKELSNKSGGLGLGLSIAKENIKLLGGDIRLESKKGVGSTFFITIPYKPVYTNNEKAKKEGDIQNKHTILIAEDEEINYLYLEILLNDVIGLDCEIIHAKNGLEAVEKCKENPAIDFVLMDLKMPIMYGYEATKQIKMLRPKLPIVVQTAYSRLEEQERAALAGCDDFISKPISQEILKKMINKYLITKLIT